ncbi:hypothetical protein GWK47_000476 [Chionoecetes opilio]|uniref:Uncharacterized protein n=1 Tax=Chionoecetes opilio TaxID=41210 RepID=A0A8J4YIT7_CHIOP|nr:hypothetical protein GWK47_000476 [Chionoecetes opilio]
MPQQPDENPSPFHQVYLRVVSPPNPLRLGYRCASQILQTAPDQCPYCFEIEDDPPHHYILRAHDPGPPPPWWPGSRTQQRSSGTSDSLCLNSNARNSL